MKVLSIDPGGTTGICLVNDTELIWCSEIREIPHLVKALGKLIGQADAVVIEDFVGSGAAKDYYDPVRVIGAVEAVMVGSHLPLVKQVPGKQMRYREQVREMHKSPHVRSALAHAFYYLKSKGRI